MVTSTRGPRQTRCTHTRLGPKASAGGVVLFMLLGFPWLDAGGAAKTARASSGMMRTFSTDTPPAFAVRFADKGAQQHRPTRGATGESWVFEDGLLRGEVCEVDEGVWELDLTIKSGTATQVWFPWVSQPEALNGDRSDDVIYYPYLLGVAQIATNLRDWGWQGLKYPGSCISPLVVLADAYDGRLVAAVNWPPRAVSPMYCRQGLALCYDETLRAGQRQTYRAMVRLVRGDGADGRAPWQLALDPFKRWLKDRLRDEKLAPIEQPAWLAECHGWLNVQLENMPRFDATEVRGRWRRWKAYFPWMQFWGQMSNYAGPARLAHPVLAADEQVGCCLDSPEMHARYRPNLIEFAREIAREGRVGFYSRPRAQCERLDRRPTDDEDLDFLLDWQSRNRNDYGANAFYIDVLGGRYFGEPLKIARMIKTLPPGAVIEGGVDVYPAAFLVSGGLGGGDWSGGPKRGVEALTPAAPRTTFPAFGRYLLDEHIIFLGQSNGDHQFWGPKNNYWTERQAFLLGAKFDVISPEESRRTPAQMNQALRLAIEERERVGWWSRRPIYRHRAGVSDVPREIDVRCFRGAGGEDLLVFDNWNNLKSKQIRFDDVRIDVPARPLSIVIRERGGASRD